MKPLFRTVVLPTAMLLVACGPSATDADDFAREESLRDGGGDTRTAAPFDGGAPLDGRRGAETSARDGETTDAAPADAGRSRADAAGTLLFTMQHAAFPSDPGPHAAVHIPPDYDPSLPLEIAIYIHGWSNCVRNALGSVDTPCTDGGSPRGASRIAEQFDDAGVNAILVAPEYRVDRQSGDPGEFDTRGAFSLFLEELFGEKLAPYLGKKDPASIRRSMLMGHSGAYQAMAALIRTGDVPALREVILLDALYGEQSTFEAWVYGAEPQFKRPTTRGPHDFFRFADVYTSAGGTLTESRSMAGHVETRFAPDHTDAILDDDSTRTLAEDEFLVPILFKRSALSHGDVSRYYPRRFFSASGFTRSAR